MQYEVCETEPNTKLNTDPRYQSLPLDNLINEYDIMKENRVAIQLLNLPGYNNYVRKSTINHKPHTIKRRTYTANHRRWNIDTRDETI